MFLLRPSTAWARQAIAKHALRAAERQQVYLLTGPLAVVVEPPGMGLRRVSVKIPQTLSGEIFLMEYRL